MNDLAALIAMVIFCISSYLIYDLFQNGFDIFVLLGAITGFVIVHYLWPRSRDSSGAWYEALEFIFDLPYRTITLIFRGVFSKSDRGDLDIDL